MVTCAVEDKLTFSSLVVTYYSMKQLSEQQVIKLRSDALEPRP